MTIVSDLIRNNILSQYNESPVLLAFLEALASEGDALSIAIHDVIDQRSILQAEGVNLDILGLLVGQSRSVVDTTVQIYFGFDPDPLALPYSDLNDPSLGGIYRSADDPEITTRLLTDPEYRQVILAAIQRNISTCTPNEIIQAVEFVLAQIGGSNIPLVTIIDGNTYYTVFIGRNLGPAEEAFFKDLNLLPKPAGVKANYVDYDINNYFGFLADPLAKGFGKLSVVLYRLIILALANVEGYWRLGDAGTPFLDEIAGRDVVSLGFVTPGLSPLIDNNELSTSVFFRGAYASNYLQGVLNAAYENVNTISIEAWFRLDNYDSFIGGYHTATTADSGGYALGVSPTGAMRFYTGFGVVQSGNVLGEGFVEAPGIVPLHQVIHAVGTYDLVSGGRRLYVNGSMVFQDAPGLPLDYADYGIGRRLLIGQGFLNGNPVGVMHGTIDQFAVYSQELSATDVLSHYTAGNLTTPPVFSEGWGLTGANYDAVSYSLSALLTLSYCSYIRRDGGRMYVVAQLPTIAVYQLDFGTPNDLNTLVYNGVFLNLGAVGNFIRAITFKDDDGSKMFIFSAITNNITEYDISDPWEVNTGVINANIFNLDGYATNGRDMTFTYDGAALLFVDSVLARVWQFNLLTPWMLQTASRDFLDVSALIATARGIGFNDTDLIVYVVDATGANIYQLDLAIAGDIDTAVYNGVFLDFTAIDNAPMSISVINAGARIMVIGAANQNVFQLDLVTTDDIGTAVYSGVFYDFSAQLGNAIELKMNAVYSRMYIIDDASRFIFQYDLTTAGSLGIVVYNGVSFDAGVQDSQPDSFAFMNAGATMIVVGANADRVHEYDLPVVYDLTVVNFTGNYLIVSPEDAQPRGVAVNSNESSLYVVGDINLRVSQYDMSVAGSLLSSERPFINMQPLEGEPNGVAIRPDGSRVFVSGEITSSVIQLDLSTPNDIATAVDNGVIFSVNAEDDRPSSMLMNHSGLTMIVQGEVSDTLYQYTLPVS